MRLGSEGDMPEAGTPKKRVDDNVEEKTKKRKFSSHTGVSIVDWIVGEGKCKCKKLFPSGMTPNVDSAAAADQDSPELTRNHVEKEI